MADQWTAFHGDRCVAAGTLIDVARTAKSIADSEPGASVLVLNDETGRPTDLNLQGNMADVIARLSTSGNADRPHPGRPKLGVVSKEVTLLPRHWDWLSQQSGGASAVLRRLVDKEMKEPSARLRQVQTSADRFLAALGGNRPGCEEASRALYAGTFDRFEAAIRDWPEDIRDNIHRIAGPAFRIAGHHDA